MTCFKNKLNKTINSENEKSVTVPLYMSFDFDENGKFIFQQHFGDISAAFLSLEE